MPSSRELRHCGEAGVGGDAEALFGGRQTGVGGVAGWDAGGVQGHAVDPSLDVGLGAEGE